MKGELSGFQGSQDMEREKEESTVVPSDQKNQNLLTEQLLRWERLQERKCVQGSGAWFGCVKGEPG